MDEKSLDEHGLRLKNIHEKCWNYDNLDFNLGIWLNLLNNKVRSLIFYVQK